MKEKLKVVDDIEFWGEPKTDVRDNLFGFVGVVLVTLISLWFLIEILK